MTTRVTRIQDYALCLWRNNIYAFMWLAECTKQAGNWFTFVAAYATIADLSGDDAALHTALFLVCRRLPYLVLFPLSGLAADRLNRGGLLIAACLLQSAVSFSLPLVRLSGHIELLYPLVLLQYSAQAFYDPARIASVPTVVPPAMLCVASTLDLMGFSLMAIFGAAVAGRTAAAYGTAVCFRIEGCAFLVSATLLLRLATWQPPHPQPEATPTRPSSVRHSVGSNRASSNTTNADGAVKVTEAEAVAVVADVGAVAAVAAARGRCNDDQSDKPPELQPLRAKPQSAVGGPEREQQRRSCGCGGFGALHFMSERRNWDVAALVWCKATGALAWGAADVLNGRFAQMSSMQTLGGPEMTLGAILVAVGLGSVAGPMIANALTPGVARWWRISIAVAFGFLAAGYLVMASAVTISSVLPATAIRTAGSATLYIHSTATLQHRLPDSVRGRLFAVEFVLWTVSEAGSTLFGGYALDSLGWSTRHLSTALSLLAAFFAVCWSINARVLWGRDSREGSLQEALLEADHGRLDVEVAEDC
ncbi:hypothetical protein Vretimale_7933 [Volvox reticuliferus]|uniref:Uncharacterized protein n=1 Tax=Volvox reticuliferus TaxID=1737510 RepID=A0A8J4GAS4_9CHLO|nr:hypothetical protein Vretifemale_5109 [Volvox reticuliferus]GIM03243.1 hypothetical protein Vretimale_7933 [Volvox reticuliferus]